MALKAKVTKDEFAGLADPIKEHYKEADGAYVLEGLTDAGTVRQFRDNNERLTRELNQMRDQWKDLDPAAVRDALSELERRKKQPDDFETRLNAALEARVKPLQTRIQTIETEKANLQKEKEATHFHSTIEAAARKAGVIPDHLEDVVNRASNFGFKVVDGTNIRALRGEDPIRDEKTGAEVTVDMWLKQMPPGFFGRTSGSGPGSGGSGAGQGGTGQPVGGTLYDPDALTFSKHAEKIAKGELRVVRS